MRLPSFSFSEFPSDQLILSSIASSPDQLFLRSPDQIISEIRMGDGDQFLRTFPGGQAFHIHHTIFRGNIVYLTSGRGYDIPSAEMGQDIGFMFPIFINIGRIQTDKGFASPGQGCPLQKIQLTSGSADLLHPYTFCADLPKQIHTDAAVDGNHIINLPDNIRDCNGRARFLQRTEL